MIIAFVIGCGDKEMSGPHRRMLTDQSGSRPFRVVATTGMVADVVRAVGGDVAEVHQLMGSGVDPHLYKPIREDVRAIMAADVIFTSGLMLEGRMQDTFRRLSESRPVVAVSEQFSPDVLMNPDGTAEHADPHVWMDVSMWSACVDVVCRTLSEMMPEHRDKFRQRATAYRTQLMELHTYGLTVCATIPEAGRILVTSHDAFHYFGRAYGLEVLGVQGISTDSETGLKRINSLVDLLVNRRVGAVFVESSVPQKNIRALVDGARSRGHEVTIGGELFSDAMGEPGTYTGTYVGMLDHNISVVTRALGGRAPPQGFQGLLDQ